MSSELEVNELDSLLRCKERRGQQHEPEPGDLRGGTRRVDHSGKPPRRAIQSSTKSKAIR